jgi:hypothetical protein
MVGIHKLLVIYCDYGRLGNRLHTHANALAWCIENNYNLINLSFSEYAEFFNNSPKHNSGNLKQNGNFIFKSLSGSLMRKLLRKLLLSDKWLERLAWVINQIKPTNSELLKEEDLCRQINRKKINLIRHWDLNCRNSMEIQQDKLRNYLCPSIKFVVSAKRIIAEMRSKYDCIIGVHARRGDYITYLGGKHYHSWETYLSWANQAKQVLEKYGNKKVGIAICSDEIPSSSTLTDEDVYFSSSNGIMVDIHLLSLCDYNLGPPSSFGTWISWYGNVPRLIINKETKIDNLENFAISNIC